MPATMPWLDKRKLLQAGKQDYTWFFTFSDEATVATESMWRLLTQDGVAITSADEGQKFGLISEVDAAAKLISIVGENSVTEVRVTEGASDLQIYFGDGVILEFLTTSSGYESWRVSLGSDEIICTGGGNIEFFTHEKKS